MTKYDVEFTSRFKKDARRAERQGRDMALLRRVVAMLSLGEPLPSKFRDHPLKGNRQGLRECHIETDWLLIYKIENACSSFSLFRALELMQIFLENKRKAFCKRILIRHKRPGG